MDVPSGQSQFRVEICWPEKKKEEKHPEPLAAAAAASSQNLEVDEGDDDDETNAPEAEIIAERVKTIHETDESMKHIIVFVPGEQVIYLLTFLKRTF